MCVEIIIIELNFYGHAPDLSRRMNFLAYRMNMYVNFKIKVKNNCEISEICAK